MNAPNHSNSFERFMILVLFILIGCDNSATSVKNQQHSLDQNSAGSRIRPREAMRPAPATQDCRGRGARAGWLRFAKAPPDPALGRKPCRRLLACKYERKPIQTRMRTTDASAGWSVKSVWARGPSSGQP